MTGPTVGVRIRRSRAIRSSRTALDDEGAFSGDPDPSTASSIAPDMAASDGAATAAEARLGAVEQPLDILAVFPQHDQREQQEDQR